MMFGFGLLKRQLSRDQRLSVSTVVYAFKRQGGVMDERKRDKLKKAAFGRRRDSLSTLILHVPASLPQDHPVGKTVFDAF